MNAYSNIDLQNLQSIYDSSVMPYQYTYELEDGSMIHLSFEPSQMGHLLGIQKVDYLRSDLKGQRCYDNIQNGTLTMDVLKSINASRTASNCKSKMKYFDELPNVLGKPDCVEFDPSIAKKGAGVRMKYALSCISSDSKNKLVLGIDTDDPNGQQYFPTTWLVEPVSQDDILTNQRQIAVNGTEVSKK